MGIRFFLLALVLAVFFSPHVCAAQQITGSTTVDIDPDTNNVQIACETNLDDAAAAYYVATVTCTVSVNGTFLETKTGTSARGNTGNAIALFSIAGSPGSTYSAIGTHGGTIVYIDPNEIAPQQNFYYDFYNFTALGNYGDASNQEIYPDSFVWTGLGPPEDQTTKTVSTGKTTAGACTAPPIPTSLPPTNTQYALVVENDSGGNTSQLRGSFTTRNVEYDLRLQPVIPNTAQKLGGDIPPIAGTSIYPAAVITENLSNPSLGGLALPVVVRISSTTQLALVWQIRGLLVLPDFLR